MNEQTIADMEIAGKRVLIRADLNVPSNMRIFRIIERQLGEQVRFAGRAAFQSGASVR